MKEVRCALEAYSEWHCPAIKGSGKTMTVIKHQHLFDLNWQNAASSQAVLLTKVFAGGPVPLIPHFSFSAALFLFIYFFFPHHQLHSTYQIINNDTHTQRGEWIKRRVKNSRKPGDTQSCLRVVVVFPPLGSIVRNCNQTSGGKIKSLFCYQNTGTWPWVSKASEQNRIARE